MIRYKPLGIIIIVAIQVVVFAYFVRKDNAKAERTSCVTKDMEIVPLTINQISDRGALFINDTLVINSRSTAIDFPQKFNGWATHGPIVDFDTLSHKYRLEDLRIPYILSKRAHCDTIYVIKDGHELKFFLEEFE